MSSGRTSKVKTFLDLFEKLKANSSGQLWQLVFSMSPRRATGRGSNDSSFDEGTHRQDVQASWEAHQPNNIDAVNLRVSVSIMYIAHIQWLESAIREVDQAYDSCDGDGANSRQRTQLEMHCVASVRMSA